MAQIPDSVAQSIERFLDTVKKQKYLEAAYLYGSYARGTAHAWSDIDLALVSKDFSSDLFEEQLKLRCLAAKMDDRIELKAFTPEDFHSNDPLVFEIQRTGMKIL